MTLLSVNTFVQDCEDKNPLIRSLALRTMACLRVQSVIEYLVPLLDRCLDDVDPYVRKTAAVCVAKLYDMAPDRCEEEGFILRLRKMIGDSSPFVVSNAVFALQDISETLGTDALRVNSKLMNRLLVCLEECSEWGQIAILEALSRYIPQDEAEASQIIERVAPRLQHALPPRHDAAPLLRCAGRVRIDRRSCICLVPVQWNASSAGRGSIGFHFFSEFA